MADKYIIEKHEKDSIWRMYADAYGDVTVEGVDLTPYTEPDIEKVREVREEAYQEGYRRALADVREEHVCQTCVYFERDENEEPCVRCPRNFLDQYTPKQENEEQIQVGDEVEGDEDGQRGVVIDSRFENSQVAVLTGNSKVYSWWSKCAIHKTGRHFPEIAEVLRKMKEES